MSLQEYKASHAIGKRLSEEIPKLYGFDENLKAMIQVFGIIQGKNNIVLESEEEINFLIDFYLHEYLHENQTPLEKYRANHPNLSPQEIQYLDAAKASYTSLFKIIEVNPMDSSVTVVDLLNPSDKSLTIINAGLSNTAQVDQIIFSRFLPYPKFNAFSGMYALFDKGSDRSLLKRYKVMKNRVKSNRESVQRFIAFFKINRIVGLSVHSM